MTVTPAMRHFLDEVQAMLDAKAWPALARDAVTVTPGRDCVLAVLPHAHDPALAIECEIDDRAVRIAYGTERIQFSRRDEALRFLEMLGDGRVELVVQRNPVWTALRSYRDGLALPFHKTGHPWPNLRFATERHRFGFT